MRKARFKGLSDSQKESPHIHHEGLISAISAGFFLILIGMLFITIPNLSDRIVSFAKDFNTVKVPNLNGVYLPAPTNPGIHTDVYLAAREFSIVWGIFLIAMLGVRFIFDSPLRRKARNLGDVTFWLGATYLIQTWLINASVDITGWFEFWTAIIMLIGISLIARAAFLFIAEIVRT
jgi:hypothetical protein